MPLNKHQQKTYTRFGIDTNKPALTDEDVRQVFTQLAKGNLNWHNDRLRERLLQVPRDFPSFHRFNKFFRDTIGKVSTSPVSLAYWVARGFCEDDAKQKTTQAQRQRSSPVTLEYWMNRGMPEDEARRRVRETQVERSRKGYDRPTAVPAKQRSPRSKEFWIAKGYSTEQAEVAVRELYAKHSQTLKGRAGWVPVDKRNTRIEFYIRLGMTESEATAALRNRQTTRTLSPEQRTAFRVYYRECWYHTTQNAARVPNIHLRSDQYHLDHILSIYGGFHQKVPPHIVGSVANLRIIPATDNLRKQRRSHISKEQLINEYNSVDGRS